MRNTKIAAAIIAGFAVMAGIGSCMGGSSSSSGSGAIAGSSAPAAQTPYLSEITTVDPNVVTDANDAVLNLLGSDACDDFQAGDTSDQVVADATGFINQQTNTSITAYDMVFILVSATNNLCAAYSNTFAAWMTAQQQ